MLITSKDVDAINFVVNKCHQNAVNCGWWDKDRNDGELIALMHSELSEALEAYRKGLNDDHLLHRKGVEVEMADTVIRIFDFCGKHGLDLGGAIQEKIEYNANRADHKLENRQKEGGKKF